MANLPPPQQNQSNQQTAQQAQEQHFAAMRQMKEQQYRPGDVNQPTYVNRPTYRPTPTYRPPLYPYIKPTNVFSAPVRQPVPTDPITGGPTDAEFIVTRPPWHGGVRPHPSPRPPSRFPTLLVRPVKKPIQKKLPKEMRLTKDKIEELKTHKHSTQNPTRPISMGGIGGGIIGSIGGGTKPVNNTALNKLLKLI